MKWFRRRETHKERAGRLFKLTNQKDYGMYPPPMDAQVAIDELARYLLGNDWHIVMPIGAKQANTQIVYEIERKYREVRSK